MHNYEMPKRSLEDQMKVDGKDTALAKPPKAGATEPEDGEPIVLRARG